MSEPVMWTTIKGKEGLVPLYAEPQQRKPLTDEEIWKIYDETPSGKEQPFIIRFVRSVLAAHGIGVEQ